MDLVQGDLLDKVWMNKIILLAREKREWTFVAQVGEYGVRRHIKGYIIRNKIIKKLNDKIPFK